MTSGNGILIHEFEDYDTISFNTMLPVLRDIAIMERFVKKIGKLSVKKSRVHLVHSNDHSPSFVN
jgi:hypothetical protein